MDQSELDDGDGAREPTIAMLMERIERLQRDVDAMRVGGYDPLSFGSMRLSDLESRLEAIEVSNHPKLMFDVLQWLAALSNNENTHNQPMPRYLLSSIYLHNGGERAAASEALDRVLETFGFSSTGVDQEHEGSWWKQFFARSADVVTSDEFQQRLRKLEKAAELQALEKPQTDITKAQAEALAALFNATKEERSCAIDLGNLLLVRWTDEAGNGHSRAMHLSTEEMSSFRRGEAGRWSSYLTGHLHHQEPGDPTVRGLSVDPTEDGSLDHQAPLKLGQPSSEDGTDKNQLT